ncbi:MAG: hypothetical protein ACK5Q5_18820 [Planctomycetaceae bacterium]
MSEEQLIQRAQQALSLCNWEIGECAALWTQKYARGRTDADFGAQIGLSGDQVYQRRRVWETFADVHVEYSNLKWSHFYAATNWEDSAECLQWANDLGATVAEMKAWRRSQHGEDLAQPSDAEEEAPFGSDNEPQFITAATGFVQDYDGNGSNGRERAASVSGERDATAAAVARDAGSSDNYAPYGKGARGPATGEGRDSAAPPPMAILKRMTSTLEKVDAALTPSIVEVFPETPIELQQRFLTALDNLIAKAQALR